MGMCDQNGAYEKIDVHMVFFYDIIIRELMADWKQKSISFHK